jgi:putative acetyltransferase
MDIRAATIADSDVIKNIHLNAFPESESALVSKVAVDLLNIPTRPKVMHWVAEVDDVVVGHVAFSPVTVKGAGDFSGYILAPLGVVPAHQRCGIGSRMVKYGVQQLLDSGVNVVFVYGDPEYYSKFGFHADVAKPYLPPYPLEHPLGWQAVILKEYVVKPTAVSITCASPLCNAELW